ncbi:hypothetical protein AAFF_G00182880 [Aldrovandia affinis]|uniref:Uncharacterized protein n=1 Tax=Aldrovandia affinis TaxID=143900 RepID=A0AAD7VXE0_9TELE|nr:hypothetical protein AAFF_G00182880 [Aldrovandia affinis]
MGKPLFGAGKGEPKKVIQDSDHFERGVEGRKGQNRASEGTAENRGPEEEPEALGTGGQPTGPVSSVPAATAVGWDWWKKRLSNLPSPDNIWETGWLFATIPKEHL